MVESTPMRTLHDVISEVRANALSAVGVAPTAKRDSQALYALSDAALLEALGTGGNPRERGPVESHDGAVPSNANEQSPTRPIPSARGRPPIPQPQRGPSAAPTATGGTPHPISQKGPKRDPNGIAPGAPTPPHFGSNLTEPPNPRQDPDPWE